VPLRFNTPEDKRAFHQKQQEINKLHRITRLQKIRYGGSTVFQPEKPNQGDFMDWDYD
jgi:hypothetical protein